MIKYVKSPRIEELGQVCIFCDDEGLRERIADILIDALCDMKEFTDIVDCGTEDRSLIEIKLIYDERPKFANDL
jgi:hypothetical protein